MKQNQNPMPLDSLGLTLDKLHNEENDSTIVTEKDKKPENVGNDSKLKEEKVENSPIVPKKMVFNTSTDSLADLLKFQQSGNPLPSADQANNELRKGVEIQMADPYKKYKIEKQLGKGGHGVVVAVRSIETNKLYAMKQVESTGDMNVEYYKYTEIGHLKMSSHQNVIKYFETYSNSNYIYCVMEYMNSGTLAQFILSNYKLLNEKAIAYILHQVLSGISYLHLCNRMHRDIKSDNVLLASNGEIKLADFGYTVQLTQEKATRNTQIGTPCWMAPEIIKNQLYNQSIDIWSFGILAIELADGDPPYLNCEVEVTLTKIINCPPPTFAQPNKWSPEFQEFLGCCLKHDPFMRKSADDLLKHPFIVGKNMVECKNAYLSLLHEWLIQICFQKPKARRPIK